MSSQSQEERAANIADGYPLSAPANVLAKAQSTQVAATSADIVEAQISNLQAAFNFTWGQGRCGRSLADSEPGHTCAVSRAVYPLRGGGLRVLLGRWWRRSDLVCVAEEELSVTFVRQMMVQELRRPNGRGLYVFLMLPRGQVKENSHSR